MNKKTTLQIFFKYMLMNVIGMIGISCYILADTYFVANGIGAIGLAALNMAISAFSFMQGVGLMIGIGGATYYTVLMARGEEKKANEAFTHSVEMGIICGVLFFLIGIFFSEPIASVLGASGEALPLASSYIKIMLVFAPFFIENNILIAFVRNDGAPKLSMIGMLIGSFLNIILDYVFIYLCKWGMFGAGFATGIAPIAGILVMSTHILKKKNQFHLQKGKIKLSFFGKIAGLGISALITEFSSGVVIIVFNWIILSLEGNMGVAAYGIVVNIALVALSIYTGISQGTQPIFSGAYGRGDVKTEKNTLRYAILSCLIFAGILYAAIFFFASPLVSAFNREGRAVLQTLAIPGLKIYFIGFLFAGINIMIASFFSAVEQAKKGFLISMLRGFVAILIFVVLLSKLFHMTGVWLAFPVTEAVTLIYSLGLLFLKRDNKLTE